MQTVAERNEIILAVQTRLLPAAMSDNEGNGQLLKGFLMRQFNLATDAQGNIEFTEAQLWAAMTAIADQLEWTVPPARLQRKAIDNDLRAKQKQTAKTEQEKAEHVKATIQNEVDAQAEREITSLIDGFMVVRNGRFIRTETAARQAELLKIEAHQNGRRHSVATLALVQAALAGLRREAERGQRVR